MVSCWWHNPKTVLGYDDALSEMTFIHDVANCAPRIYSITPNIERLKTIYSDFVRVNGYLVAYIMILNLVAILISGVHRLHILRDSRSLWGVLVVRGHTFEIMLF